MRETIEFTPIKNTVCARGDRPSMTPVQAGVPDEQINRLQKFKIEITRKNLSAVLGCVYARNDQEAFHMVITDGTTHAVKVTRIERNHACLYDEAFTAHIRFENNEPGHATDAEAVLGQAARIRDLVSDNVRLQKLLASCAFAFESMQGAMPLLREQIRATVPHWRELL